MTVGVDATGSAWFPQTVPRARGLRASPRFQPPLSGACVGPSAQERVAPEWKCVAQCVDHPAMNHLGLIATHAPFTFIGEK